GALLQNRMAVALPDAARAHDAAVPPAHRAQFVGSFAKAAQSGTFGPGQHAFKAPQGTPPSAIAAIARLYHEVFAIGYVNAMHATFVLPIAILSIAALSCLAIKRTPTSVGQAPTTAALQPEASQAPT